MSSEISVAHTWVYRFPLLRTTAFLCAFLLGAARLLAFAAPARNPSLDASTALFVSSDIAGARALAAAALRRRPADPDALFVAMEGAALSADIAAEIEAAVRLCETQAENDPRVVIAAARLRQVAGNTAPFRAALPRIRKLVVPGTAAADFLAESLLRAAADGAPEFHLSGPKSGSPGTPGFHPSKPKSGSPGTPGLSLPDVARAAGLLTDWRVVGPFGTYPNLAFDRVFAPERDHLAQTAYGEHAVEAFQFYDGAFYLPGYFETKGIFYAVSVVSVPRAAEYRLRVETAGTLEIFVDGVRVLRKDARWRAGPELARSSVRLSAGPHQVLVKFLPTAAPFRVALGASAGGWRLEAGPAPPLPEVEARYVAAALPYWTGDYDEAIARLTSLGQTQPSAGVDYLLSQAWQQSSGDSPEPFDLLQTCLARAPLAAAADYALAVRAYRSEHYEEAFDRAHRVVIAHPEFYPAQELLARSASRLHSPAEAAAAFEAGVRLHPSCAVLQAAAEFFSTIAAHPRAKELEQRLEGCAPDSLAFAQVLSAAGRHGESAEAARRVARGFPLDREALAWLAKELAWAGKTAEAARVARELAALAPQSGPYRRLAEDSAGGAVVLDSPEPWNRDFAGAGEFYSPYRRDGIEVIRQDAGRQFSGGPAAILLLDRVARLGADDSVSYYFHQVTRVLNRDGIEKYGEISLPKGAELLELRTIKADGTLVEPELSPQKSTISMPALVPGDALEQEYVLRFSSGGIEEHPDLFRNTFGSFAAPILSARFVVVAPAAKPLEVFTVADAPAVAETRSGSLAVRLWERQGIPQSHQESSAPQEGTLPAVGVFLPRPGGWEDLRDRYQDAVINAVRAGPRVESKARELQGDTGEQTARNFYRMVTTRLRAGAGGWENLDIASAEDTLAGYSGSRTAVLLALARAAGLDARLLLARELDFARPQSAGRNAYTHPLVWFRFGPKDQVADAESQGLAFGVLPATLAHGDALLVPVTDSGTVPAGPQKPSESTSAALIVPVPPSVGDEHSVAEGDVTFDRQGNLSAQVTIRMGAARSAQMRAVLRGVEPEERRHFLEQVAMRIFPGAMGAEGGIRNENDPEQALELQFRCRAPRFLAVHGHSTALDQLAPILGLRKMYAVEARRLPLYIDMPLIETADFRVHLPAGFAVTALPVDLRTETEFGSYSLEFHQPSRSEIDIRRAFRIPVQLVAPDRFPEFSRFERQIDDAERQQISLAIE